MAWIKRNLFLVVGGLVALALLGCAGYFLYVKYSLDQSVEAELQQSTQELKTLVNRDPHPGTAKVNNIDAAKKEQKKLLAFLNQVRRYFAPTFTNHPSSREFRAWLDTTVSELRHRAERSGVKLPDDYWFSFSAQKATMTFPTNLVAPLTAQLLDVGALCQVLFDAKIIALEKIKRVSTGQEDGSSSTVSILSTSSSDDYLEAKGVTNQWAVVMPYELTFQGFSSELAEVLKGLIRSSNCFVLKDLSVERVDSSPSGDETTTSTPGATPEPSRNPYARYGPMMSRGYGMSPGLMQRYGLMPRGPAVPTTPRPANRSGTLLEEKALRITLSVNSVKLKAPLGK